MSLSDTDMFFVAFSDELSASWALVGRCVRIGGRSVWGGVLAWYDQYAPGSVGVGAFAFPAALQLRHGHFHGCARLGHSPPAEPRAAMPPRVPVLGGASRGRHGESWS